MRFERIKSLRNEQGRRAYALYKRSFPLNELRVEKSQYAVMKNDEYHFDLIFDDDWVGEILYWETDEFIYVEHFCMLESARNKGYGSYALKKLAEKGKTIVLEIDQPCDETSIKRKGFYERNGFVENEYPHVHPAYRKRFSGHKLVVMSYPKALKKDEYDKFLGYLCKVVMR